MKLCNVVGFCSISHKGVRKRMHNNHVPNSSLNDQEFSYELSLWLCKDKVEVSFAHINMDSLMILRLNIVIQKEASGQLFGAQTIFT